MAYDILPTGYETQVQIDMGVSESVLPTAAIQSKAALAEILIKKAVPTYAELAGDELSLLQSACIAQLCALLCPSMPQRIKIAQADEVGYSFKLQAVDWTAKKAEFEALISDLIFAATGDDSDMSAYAPEILGVVKNDRIKI